MRLFVAGFDTEAGLRDALPRLRAAGLGKAGLGKTGLGTTGLGDIETYTPKPIEDGASVLPLVVLVAGLVGVGIGFWMQAYASVSSYPIDIGGRPDFSWPSFVPIAFEIGVLSAIVAGFVGFLVVNRLPRLYDPVDEADVLREATRDRWCVAIRTANPDRVRHILRDLRATMIEELPE
jgi:hypothetical protein